MERPANAEAGGSVKLKGCRTLRDVQSRGRSEISARSRAPRCRGAACAMSDRETSSKLC